MYEEWFYLCWLLTEQYCHLLYSDWSDRLAVWCRRWWSPSRVAREQQPPGAITACVLVCYVHTRGVIGWGGGDDGGGSSRRLRRTPRWASSVTWRRIANQWRSELQTAVLASVRVSLSAPFFSSSPSVCLSFSSPSESSAAPELIRDPVVTAVLWSQVTWRFRTSGFKEDLLSWMPGGSHADTQPRGRSIHVSIPVYRSPRSARIPSLPNSSL